MIKGKRGAIELSITTIVVVVIGVTLLALGLAWVSGIFEKLQGTTKGAFEKADAEISNIFAGGAQDKPFRLSPTSISIKQGGREKASVILSNIQGPGTPTSGIRIKRPATNLNADGAGPGELYKTKVNCVMADKISYISNDYTLGSGQEVKITVYVDVAKDAPLGFYTCNFIQENLPGVVVGQQETLSITVTK